HRTASLFPYTTLFRSLVDSMLEISTRSRGPRSRDARIARRLLVEIMLDERRFSATEKDQSTLDLACMRCGGSRRFEEWRQRLASDRKSTRLNSSHVKI